MSARGQYSLIGGIDGQVVAQDLERLGGFQAVEILRADGERGLVVGSRHCESSTDWYRYEWW